MSGSAVASKQILGRFEYRPLRYDPSLKKTPKGNDPLPPHRHNANPSQSLATPSEALTKPHAQSTVRLKAPPTPRQLRGHPAHMAVAGLGDPLFPGTFAAVIWCRREARYAPDFPTILEGTPAKKCHH